MALEIAIIGVGNVEGGLEVRFSIGGNRVGKVFSNAAQAIEYLNARPFDEEVLMWLALRVWQARDPNFSNLPAVRNKTMTIDFTAQNIVTIT